MRNLTRDEARARAALLQVEAYDVHLELGEGTQFSSTTTVRLHCRQPGASSFLELDGELVHGDLDGRPLTLQGNRIVLADLPATGTVTVTARCSTTTSGEGLHRFVDPADGETYLYAQSFLDDAQRIFACFDQPDLKAVVRLTVDAPAGWQVLANTWTVAAPDASAQNVDSPAPAPAAGSRRHVFAPTPPISTYLVTLAAGPWYGRRITHDGIELGLWCRGSLAPHLAADELFSITTRCLDFQQQFFDRPYPFGISYDQVFVPQFNAGAMENPGMVTLRDDYLFRSRTTQGARRSRAQVIAHEMAHMWFGDLVTMRWWDDLWLNEAFAEYLGVLTVDRATEHAGGWTDFCIGRKAWGYRADQLPTTHPVAADVADTRTALLNFDGISYAKGAAALRQLAAWLGEDVFLGGVRHYLRRHAWGCTSLADLLQAFEQVSGRDLQEWARLWLRTAGVPILRVVDGAVVQDAAVLRPHRLDIGLYDEVHGSLRLRGRLPVEVSDGLTELPRFAPADLVLPNDGDLTFAKVRLSPRSLASVSRLLGTMDDLLARAVCWGALWDATRDADLPAADLVAAVLGHAHAEADPDVLATLLRQAGTAARCFSRDPALLARLHGYCSSGARDAEAGSDRQLVFVRAVADTAAEPGVLPAWLAGSALPEGLVVDGDLRWHLTLRLAALGGIDAAGIARELAADRTASGEQGAAWAAAARPDPAAKCAAWDELTAVAAPSNARARALAGGFWQPGQDELLRPYVARYVAEVPGLWQRHGPQLAGSVTALLFPSTLLEQAVLEATDPLVTADRPAGLRRTVLEQRDDLARALRARAR